MSVYASRVGVSFYNYATEVTVDQEIKDAIGSNYMALCMGAMTQDMTDRLDDAKKDFQWTLWTAAEYNTKVTSNNPVDWEAGPRAGQSVYFNRSNVNVANVVLFIIPFNSQPYKNSYARHLNWIGLSLADLYPNISRAMAFEVQKWELLDQGNGGIGFTDWQDVKFQTRGWKPQTYKYDAQSGKMVVERHGPKW